MSATATQRFWAKVDKRGLEECWLWTASLFRLGYGQFRAGPGQKRNVLAHRFSYEVAHGPIPVGLCVMHTCDNRRCVNPAHLRLGTHTDNMRDCAAKGRNCRVGWSRQTHCVRGHAFDEANTRITPKGHRACRRCSRERFVDARNVRA